MLAVAPLLRTAALAVTLTSLAAAPGVARAQAGDAARVPNAPSGCLPRCRTGYTCEADACVALPDPHDYRHEGFFLRFEVGPGYADARLGDLEAHGLGYQLGIAVGAAVVENLIVMVSANELIARNVGTNRDAAFESLFGDVRIDLGVREATLGAGYYLMPANVFAGAHVGLGFAQINANGIESDIGPSLGLDLTKEWWVGAAWGLGIALRLVWMKLALDERFQDSSQRDDVEVLAARLSFAATFN